MHKKADILNERKSQRFAGRQASKQERMEQKQAKLSIIIHHHQ